MLLEDMLGPSLRKNIGGSNLTLALLFIFKAGEASKGEFGLLVWVMDVHVFLGSAVIMEDGTAVWLPTGSRVTEQLFPILFRINSLFHKLSKRDRGFFFFSFFQDVLGATRT